KYGAIPTFSLPLEPSQRQAATKIDALPVQFCSGISATKKATRLESPFPFIFFASLRRDAKRAREERPTVIAAMGCFDQVFRMRHHAEHIAACIDDTGNVVDRSVGIGAISV